MSEQERVPTYTSLAEVWGFPIVCGLITGIITMASIMYWLVEKLGPSRGGPAGMAIASATSLGVILLCRLIVHFVGVPRRRSALKPERDPS